MKIIQPPSLKDRLILPEDPFMTAKYRRREPGRRPLEFLLNPYRFGGSFATQAIHMDFEGSNGSTTFTDTGSAGTTWTRDANGGSPATSISTAQILAGTSSLFTKAGGNGYLEGTANAANRLPANSNFSLKFKARASSWLRPDTVGSYVISIQDAGSTAAGTQFAIATNSGNFPLLVYSDGTTRSVNTSSVGTLPTNSDLDFEFKRVGTTLTVLINGTAYNTVTGFSGSFPAASSTVWRISAPTSANSGQTNGMYFDSFTLNY